MSRWWFGGFCLFLSACSGGGSGDNSDPTTPVAATNTAPNVAVANLDQSADVGYELRYDAGQAGGTFDDADDDNLTLVVTIDGNTDGLSVSGSFVEGIPENPGTVSVVVTATDPSGATASDSFDIVIGIDQSAIVSEFAGSIDLANLSDYEGQTAPDYITKLNDGGNPIDDRMATLGRVLFYDTELSIDRTVACSSCHAQARAFTDTAVVSTGVEGGQTGRHSMRLVNTQFADEENFFWDERADSHEAQETQPIHDHNELGFSGDNGRPTFDDLITRLEAIEYYEELFRFAFFDAEITEERLQLALANFTKALFSFDSRYDEGLAGAGGNLNANFANFSASENAGKDLYMTAPNNGGAGCQACHRAPEFDIAPNRGHNGVVGVAGLAGQFDFTNTRSPTLRDLVGADGLSNGPFMHDGSLVSLADVIEHYNDVPVPAGVDVATFFDTLDNRLQVGGNNTRNLNLSEQQKDDLEAFLLTLTGSTLYTDEKYTDPF